MVKRYTIALFCICALNILYAQEQVQFCDDVVPFCALNDLNGFTETMFDMDVGGPNPLCQNSPENGGGAHNMSWFGFVAGSTSFTITINLENCTEVMSGGQTVSGVQFGVYDDCNYSNSPFCEPDCTTGDMNGDVTFTINNLTIGDDYFIFLDGCAGSVCDYTVTIDNGGQFNPIPEFNTPAINCISTPCDEICSGAQDLEFELNNYDLSVEYTWTLTPSVPGFSTSVVDGEFSVIIDEIPTAGNYTLCVSANNGCDNTDVDGCIQLTVTDIPDEEFMLVDVCEDTLSNGISLNNYDDVANQDPNGDGVEGWAEFLDVFSPGMYSGTASNALGCEWEQTIEIVSLPLPSTNVLDTFFCSTDGSMTIDGFNFNSDDEFTFVGDTPAPNGCPQWYDVTVYEVAVETVVEGVCLPNGTIDLSFTVQTLPDDIFNMGFGATSTWYWERNGTIVSGSTDALTWNTNTSGTWAVVYTIEVDGVQCDNFFDSGTQILIEDYTPGVEELMFPLVLCPESVDNIDYSLDVEGYVGNESDFTINWTIPADIMVTGGDVNSPNVTLDFSNSSGGTICYEVTNVCGTTNVCKGVIIAPDVVPDFDIIGEPCPDGTFSVEASIATFPFDTIIWDLDGATSPDFAGNENTTGPFTLEWPGDVTDQIVTATITYVEGCQSYEHKDTLEFKIDPTFTTLDCFSDQESITFFWTDVDDAIDYTVLVQNIVAANPGWVVDFDPANNELVITGLQQGDSAELQLEAVGPGGLYCNAIISNMSDCETRVCPMVDVSLTNPFPDTICIGQDMTTGVFSATIVGDQSGVEEFTSTSGGIDAAGNFDAATAGPGTHYIDYEYDITGCRYFATDSVIVTALPTFTMDVMDLVVCSGDTTMIIFSGDYDPSIIPSLQTNGATIVSDNGTEIEVFWDTPGTKSISSNIYAVGCGQITQNLSVEVQSLPPLSLTCQQTTSSSIVIEWNTDTGFDDYEIEIGGVVTNTTGNTHTVDMLSPLTEIFFTVTGISNNACKNVIDTITCTSVDCPPVILDANLDDTILCVDENSQVIQVTGSYDNTLTSGNETLTITIDGAVSADGMFDPVTATEGDHLVELELEDDNCKFNDNFTITIEKIPGLTTSAPDRICITDTWMVDYTGDVNGNFSYDWTLSDTRTFAGATNQSIDFDTPGTYTLELASTSTNCDAGMTTEQVEVVDSLRTPQLSCITEVDQITFNWLDQNDECDQYYAVFVNGMAVGNQDDLFLVVDQLPPDSPVTIEVINESDDCICPAKTATLTCRTEECPTIQVDIDQADEIICRKVNETQPLLNLSVTASQNIDDHTIAFAGDGVSGTTFDPTGIADGMVTISVTVSKGFCEYTDDITVQLISIPEASFGYMTTICIEDDLDITYNGDNLGSFGFQWNGNGLTIPNMLSPTIGFDTPGMFNFDFVTTSTECGMEQFPLSVTVLDSLRTPEVDCNAGLDNMQITFNVDETDCDGEISVLVNGMPFTGDISTGMIDFTDLDAGTNYTIEVVNSSNCGCDDKSRIINCQTDPCPSLNFSENCSAGLDNIDIAWNLDIPDCGGDVSVTIDGVLYTGDISSNLIQLIDLTANTTVDVDIAYTSNCGCDDTFSFQCQTDPCPTVNLAVDGSTDVICVEDSQITTQLSANDDNGDLTTVVTWSGQGIDANGMITLSPDAIADGVQTYTAEYELAGCTYSADYTIEYINTIDVEAIVEEPCPGETQATFTIVNAIDSPNVEYVLDGTTLTETSNISIGEGNYILEAIVGAECSSQTNFSFTAQPEIELDFTGPTLEFAGVENEYAVVSNYNFDEVVWSVNGELFTGSPATFAFFGPGEICVTGYIGDDCEITVCKDVQVDVERIWTPNIFHPDGGGENSRFMIFSNVEIARIVTMEVYDRWGNKVFHVTDVPPGDPRAEWDGTNNGEPLEQGVYVYTGLVEFLSGEEFRFIGDITLWR